jgi:hypothetical protein
MKVTEQIDALQTMAINPVRYLANPRITAGIIMMPIVVIFANMIAILGAIFIGYDLHSLSEIFKFLEKDIKVFLFNVAGNGIYNILCDLLQKHTDIYNGNPNTYRLLYDVWSSRELKTLIEMSCKFPKLVEEK